jgi:hypothetical protein
VRAGFPQTQWRSGIGFPLAIFLDAFLAPLYSQTASRQAWKQEENMERSVITIRVTAQERQLFQALLRAEGNTMQEYLATIVREKIQSAPEALKDLVRGSEGSNGT